jgi:hypothetical protein
MRTSIAFFLKGHLATLAFSFETHVSAMDDSESSELVLAHILLLVGCALPVWVWYAIASLVSEQTWPRLYLLAPHLGMLTTGLGDAMVRR